MKKIIFALSFLLLVMNVHARGIQEEADLSEEKSKVSYSLGMVFGMEIGQIGLELDYKSFNEGFIDILEYDETRFSKEEANEIVQAAFEKAIEQKSRKLQLMEEEFLAINEARPDIKTTESGLQYMIIEEGSGPKPTIDDTIRVEYEGTLIDGTIFDSTNERQGPEDIPLNMVISGWAEGIMLMNAGSKYRLYIPSSLAYGEWGVGQIIPQYSTLIFTVDLLDIIAGEEPETEPEVEPEAESTD